MRNWSHIRHVILDRDGVINEESPDGYVLSRKQWKWIPGSIHALSILTDAGIAISVATNQSCIGRGLINESQLTGIHDKMKKEAAKHGAEFAGIYFCPHSPEQDCRCRKPAPGLLETAIKKSGFARAETLFIGDTARDLQAGQAAGITSLLVRTGHGGNTEADLKNSRIKDIEPEAIFVFDDLLSACMAITD